MSLQIVCFSRQIHDERIEMRAKSLFTVDKPLIVSFISGVMSYLVS